MVIRLFFICSMLLAVRCSWPICEPNCNDGYQCIAGACKKTGCVGPGCVPTSIDNDEIVQGNCPADMVKVPGLKVCIDRYESSYGPDGKKAISAAGRFPLHRITWVASRDACAAAGKRLCKKDEWTSACVGKLCEGLFSTMCSNVFPYGPTYDLDRCKTERPAHEAKNIGPSLTGASVRCQGGVKGLWDMSGNVKEWIDDCSTSTCETRGGGYADSGYSAGCERSYGEYRGIRESDWYGNEGNDIGFRCCQDEP